MEVGVEVVVVIVEFELGFLGWFYYRVLRLVLC